MLRRAAGVRLLLGAEPLPAARLPERRLGDPRGERYEKRLADEELDGAERKLRRDRDRLPFSAPSRASVRELLDFLDSGKIEVRRYEHRFLHGKAFLFSGKQGVLAGSSNFTLAGLTSNLELNLGQYQPGVVERVEKWFDRLWNDARPYDLAAIYREQFAEHPPYLIYLRALWERYGGELEEEAGDSGRIRLTRFQTDGVFRAKRILDQYNGVLVADSVGLGKSFIAAEIFTEVIERNRQRALLIAPAQLTGWDVEAVQDGATKSASKWCRSSNWRATGSLGEGDGSALGSSIGEYSLVVIDEAHAFRNRGHEARARASPTSARRPAAEGGPFDRDAGEQLALGPVRPPHLLRRPRRGVRGPRHPVAQGAVPASRQGGPVLAQPGHPVRHPRRDHGAADAALRSTLLPERQLPTQGRDRGHHPVPGPGGPFPKLRSG